MKYHVFQPLISQHPTPKLLEAPQQAVETAELLVDLLRSASCGGSGNAMEDPDQKHGKTHGKPRRNHQKKTAKTTKDRAKP